MRVGLQSVVLAPVVLAGAATAGELSASRWTRVAEGHAGTKAGSVLLRAPDLGKMVLIGDGVGAFDPASRAWSRLSEARPAAKRGINPYYQSAYDPETRTVYCLSGGPVMYSFSVPDGAWRTHPGAPELEGLSWHSMAHDPEGRRLVVVGSDKRPDNLGWTRTVLYDIAAGRWSPLPLPDERTRKAHRELVAATEQTIDLVGRTRMAWFRDPRGVGTEGEMRSLLARCRELAGLPGMAPFKADVEKVAGLLKEKKTLQALRAARAVQRRIEEAAFEQYPVPCSRRNSPLVYDAKNKVFVLFGGDHEDYLMNDTWVLDPKKSWRRASPELAPSPRAGHALAYLPGSGKIAMYEGYVQSSNTGYGSGTYHTKDPRQLWLYDANADRWELAGAWRAKGGAALPASGFFYGYACQFFSPPAMAADSEDRLVLAVPGTKRRKGSTWMMRVESAGADTAGRGKLGAEPNIRLYRKRIFVASFCETETPPKPTGLDQLVPNRWVRLPPPPANPCRGRRQRDWGTHVWDSDRDQVLAWGGGHCVQCCSPVAHYSPVSGRIVEGYDADEPYGRNGGGGFDSSILNRPWISVHNYNHYAYDPRCRLLVTARGYLYDPDRMDWLRMEPLKAPFRFQWSSTLVETTPHGAVAWARRARGDGFGLWLFDREKGWVDLEAEGKLHGVYCDSDGACYDSRRDRLLMGWGGGYGKRGDGTITSFDFKTKKLEKITPGNIELGKMANTREMVYLPTADVVLFGSDPYTVGGSKKGRRLTRVYHCGHNKYYLLDAGDVAYGHSCGWMYDDRRKNVYVFSYRGACWAMKVDAASLRLSEKAPEK